MENNRKDPSSMVDTWLDEILEKNNITPQIGPDEQAASSAGLTHPDDLELERIVKETLEEDFSDAFPQDPAPATPKEAPAPEPTPQKAEVPEKESLIRKLRPKAQKGYGLFGIPHILSTCIWLLLILVIGVSLGRTLWLCAEDVLALGKAPHEVTVNIDIQDRLPDIAQKLKKVGMIRYPGLFEQFARLTGKGNHILTGSITFNGDTVYDYNALINAMSYRGGSNAVVEVMIPEGYNCAQIFSLLANEGVCEIEALEEYAANGELNNYWFLEGVERGHKYCLEGFLFPDTYQFYKDDEPRRVLEKLLDDFDYRFTDRMRQKLNNLNQKLGYVHMDLRELVTMASIIEKEKANSLEGYDISSVFYNRLTHASQYPYLQSDATILYATDYLNAGELTTDELINASPYNSYTQPGLPPGPIANPGLSSLDAALDPEDTSYYYFIYDESIGSHRFSKTLEEHNTWYNKLGYGS